MTGGSRNGRWRWTTAAWTKRRRYNNNNDDIIVVLNSTSAWPLSSPPSRHFTRARNALLNIHRARREYGWKTRKKQKKNRTRARRNTTVDGAISLGRRTAAERILFVSVVSKAVDGKTESTHAVVRDHTRIVAFPDDYLNPCAKRLYVRAFRLIFRIKMSSCWSKKNV